MPLNPLEITLVSCGEDIVVLYIILTVSFLFNLFCNLKKLKKIKKSPVVCCVKFAAGEAAEMYAVYDSDGHCI